VPEVNESLLAIDDAMKLGYNWLQGPFEIMDVIGVDNFIQRLDEEQRVVPQFLRTAAGKSFYRVRDNQLQTLYPDGGYQVLERVAGVRRFGEERRTIQPLAGNETASYFNVGQGIGLVEFHSKANTLDSRSMKLLRDAVKHASENFTGLVIHNDAAHFSCGVNLGGVLEFIKAENWNGLDRFLADFQDTVIAMKYAPIPVVAAPSGLSLGGGFEVVLHCDKVIFHANSVTGLVETLVGLVPGGGGVKETLYRWNELLGDETQAAWKTFMNVGYGNTARSPLEAQSMAMYREDIDEYVMNRDRLLDRAVEAALNLSAAYTPQRRGTLEMPGREVWAEMRDWLRKYQQKGSLTPHDVTTGTQIAMIVSGGDVDTGTSMGEGDILGLERRAFLTLAKTAETKARILHMLEYGSPLRN
jgi:3-hydroxyacyl-CoA dehydrogenase